MRKTFPWIAAALLTACGGGTGKGPGAAADTVPSPDTTAVLPPAPVDWPGYYDDTLPCADCPGILTQLWVRSDSTFILRQRYIDRGDEAVGLIGQWHVVVPDAPGAAPLLTIGMAGDKPDFYARTTDGLRMVDEMGHPFASAYPHGLEKLADEINDEVPRMRLKGTFTYLADAMSFRPCGARYSWPCAGGEEQGGGEGEVLNSMGTVDLQKAYLRAVKQGGHPWGIEVECSLGMGPAMEGDGADEYIFIHRVEKEGITCP